MPIVAGSLLHKLKHNHTFLGITVALVVLPVTLPVARSPEQPDLPPGIGGILGIVDGIQFIGTGGAGGTIAEGALGDI